MAKKNQRIKSLNSEQIQAFKSEYQRAKKSIEDYLKSQKVERRKDSSYLREDPEERPFSIYFIHGTEDNYSVRIGLRITKIENIILKKRGESQRANHREPSRIEIDTPFYSASFLNRRLAATLAAKLYSYLLENHQPCDINFRTYSRKYDSSTKINKAPISIIFSNKKRYRKGS